MTVIEHDTRTVIDTAGIYPDLTDDEYHADPVPDGSLSHSGARLLLDCPARWLHARTHPTTSDAFDFGHVAHRLVLGAGAEYAVLEFDDYKKKAAQEARDEARANGLTPILRDAYATAVAMADAVRTHPIAGLLLGSGVSELSMFWQDGDVWRRARIDKKPDLDGRTILGDYKTTTSANPTQFARSVANYGYHGQADWYLDGWAALTGDTDAAFVFIIQEKTAPYLVSVVELDHDALNAGHALNQRALAIYRACRDAGHWPAYPDEITRLSLPRWAITESDNTSW